MGVAMWQVGRMPRFLAKASLFKVPVLGAIMRRSKQVPVERAGISAWLRSARGGAPDHGARPRRHHLSRGHAHPRSRPLADARQARRGADGAGCRHPDHPGRALGHAAGAAALRQAQPLPAQEDRRQVRRSGRPVRVPGPSRHDRRRSARRPRSSCMRSPRCSRTCGARRRRPSAGIRPRSTSRRRALLSQTSASPCSGPGRGARRSPRSSPTAAPRRCCGRGARSSRARSPSPSATATTCRASICRARCAPARDLEEVLDGAEQVYISVPSQSLRENLGADRRAACQTTPSSCR